LVKSFQHPLPDKNSWSFCLHNLHFLSCRIEVSITILSMQAFIPTKGLYFHSKDNTLVVGEKTFLGYSHFNFICQTFLTYCNVATISVNHFGVKGNITNSSFLWKYAKRSFVIQVSQASKTFINLLFVNALHYSWYLHNCIKCKSLQLVIMLWHDIGTFFTTHFVCRDIVYYFIITTFLSLKCRKWPEEITFLFSIFQIIYVPQRQIYMV